MPDSPTDRPSRRWWEDLVPSLGTTTSATGDGNRLHELDEGDNRVPVTLTGPAAGTPAAAAGSPAVPCG
ncbi:hypothetical protein ACFFSW_30925 [Saccharothrix longispora]|uniref:Uncharacterized protein n=1 Tax=Saccharothrix longispora TaxID=33920 RepID=A0ABU1PUE0_9PSEU|nr:hypothetical protein [Saccharothrix longispora]MDR6594258.1 hypothetical protein [Saccharothrix longispora]